MDILTPLLMTPKLLFQELCVRDLDWDQSLDSDVAETCKNLEHELAHVNQIKLHGWLLSWIQ